jgi:16S rRNA (guanine966-N2)-methyltransferase
VAGRAKGRRLAVPGTGTRPTSDRAREALFSALESALLDRGGLVGTRFLDLYAGSGAVGLEALSRGAQEVLLVEADRAAAQVLRRNIDTVDLDGATVQVAAVEQLVRSTAGTQYDVAFLDPPYVAADDDVVDVLSSLARRHWLAADALVVVERASRGPELAWPVGFEGLRSRRYGEATLWFGRFGTVAPC